MDPLVLAGLVVGATVTAWIAFAAYLFVGGRAPALHAAVPEPAVPAGRGPISGASPAPEPRPRPRRREADARSVTRRQFLNRAYLGAFVVGIANFGLASLDFLWPRLRGGFGAKITVNIPGVGDDPEVIRARLSSTRTPEFISDGRFYIMSFEGDPKKAAKVPAYKAANTLETGLVALFRKCPHLGCSVPWCAPAKWFECPCHGSKYSINGEYRDGPAPRGLDRFPVSIVGGKLVVDTAQRLEIPRGVVTSQPEPEGEHCVEVREG